MPAAADDRRVWSIFLIFLRLGLTSFGGPVAHLGYFREEFVSRRAWLSDRSFADLVALCQFLPGPASSQVGLAVGFSRGRFPGALAAWCGFSLPSALVLILFAVGLANYGDAVPLGFLHGLKCVAVAVVAQAVWGMGQRLCVGRARITIMVLSSVVVLVFPFAFSQLGVIAIAAFSGMLFFRSSGASDHESLDIPLRRRTGLLVLGFFFLLLVGLPVLARFSDDPSLARVSAFYRAGSLVFGGGHVVLPLLETAFVPSGWVDKETFLAGYGAAQAVPGPLFTFGAFLGASMRGAPTGFMGGLLGLCAIFLPSFLLVIGALPFWEELRRNRSMQAALSGVNAAVVGLLLAALYNPVWISAVNNPVDFCLVIAALVALQSWKVSPWLVVLGGGLGGWLVEGVVV